MYVGIQHKNSKPGHSGSWLWVWEVSLPPQQRAAGAKRMELPSMWVTNFIFQKPINVDCFIQIVYD